VAARTEGRVWTGAQKGGCLRAEGLYGPSSLHVMAIMIFLPTAGEHAVAGVVAAAVSSVSSQNATPSSTAPSTGRELPHVANMSAPSLPYSCTLADLVQFA
jgi:hypothetical protein